MIANIASDKTKFYACKRYAPKEAFRLYFPGVISTTSPSSNSWVLSSPSSRLRSRRGACGHTRARLPFAWSKSHGQSLGRAVARSDVGPRSIELA